jgi:hypothetical protein
MTLRAGAAAVDITPQSPVPLFGYPHVVRVAEGTHDPLWATALWLASGDGAVVLIALDLLLLDPPVARRLRQAVARATGLPEACVLISCTHTHSGPVSGTILSWTDDPTLPPPNVAYLEWLSGRVVEAAGRAVQAAVPAGLAWTTADGRDVGGNRHAAGGATDPEAGVLAVRTARGDQLLAIAVVYGMHPTVLHEDSRLVSADFPHYVREQLRDRFGDELAVLYHTGPCGNQSPRHFVSGQTFAEAERLGRKLGAAVAERVRALAAGEFVQECPLSGRLGAVTLPRRVLPSRAAAEQQLGECRERYRRLQEQTAPRAVVRTAECAVFGAEGTLTLARLQEQGTLERALRDYSPIDVQTLDLGGVHLVGFPAELFVEYGLELKQRHPGRVFPISLVGGHVQGYITTAEAAGEYEGLNAVFDGPASGRILVARALELLGLGKWDRHRSSVIGASPIFRAASEPRS